MAGDLGPIGKAYVEIRADTKQLSGDLRGAEGMFKSALGALGGLAVGYLSFRGISSAIRMMSDEAKEAAIAIAQIEARIKSTGNVAGVSVIGLQAFAAGLQKITSFSDDAILSMQGMLLSFTNVRGRQVEDATLAILDMAAAFEGLNANADSLQRMAIQVGKALQDPVEGVTALQRVGVRLSDQQKQQVKDFMAVNDIAGAQQLILKELQTEFGGTAEKLRQTPWGEQQAAANAFRDVLEKLGQSLMVSVTPGVQGLTLALEKLNESWKTVTTLWAMTPIGAPLTLLSHQMELVTKLRAQLQDLEDLRNRGQWPTKGTEGVTQWGIGETGYTPPVPVKVPVKTEFLFEPSDFGKAWREAMRPIDVSASDILPLGFPEESDWDEWVKTWTDRSKKPVEQTYNEMTAFAEQAAHNIQSKFADFLFDPFDKGLQGMLDSFMSILRRMAAEMLASQILNWLGLEKLLKKTVAHGAVFSGGEVVPMARGGIISNPTLFPMARGVGLMGEAGPEAVVPLTRTSQGDLGVKASPINLRLINAFDDGHLDRYLNGGNGERAVLNVIQRNATTIRWMVL